MYVNIFLTKVKNKLNVLLPWFEWMNDCFFQKLFFITAYKMWDSGHSTSIELDLQNKPDPTLIGCCATSLKFCWKQMVYNFMEIFWIQLVYFYKVWFFNCKYLFKRNLKITIKLIKILQSKQKNKFLLWKHLNKSHTRSLSIQFIACPLKNNAIKKGILKGGGQVGNFGILH